MPDDEACCHRHNRTTLHDREKFRFLKVDSESSKTMCTKYRPIHATSSGEPSVRSALRNVAIGMLVRAALILFAISAIMSGSYARADNEPISPETESTEEQTEAATEKKKKFNVLLLNSYHLGYVWSDDLVRGVAKSFEDSELDVELYVEYLDTKRFSPRMLEENYLPLLEKKYGLLTHHPDLIIASDDNAYQFALATADKWIGDTPVVFCGVNEFEQRQLRGHPNFSGYVQMSDVPRILHLLERLHPDAQRVAIITDDTPTGEGYRSNFLQQFPADSKFKPIWLDGDRISTAQLISRLKRLTPRTVAILTVWRRDAAGRYFTIEESVGLMSRECPVPLYGVLKDNIGSGIVGGYLQDGYKVGMEAAEMAIAILEGDRSQIGRVVPRNECSYIFDYEQLQRHGISKAKLPRGSEIINLPQTFYSKYRTEIFQWLAIAAVIQAIVLAGLYFLFLRSRRVERALSANERRYRSFIESCPIGIWQARGDKMVTVNQAFINMFEYDSAEEITESHNMSGRDIFVDSADLDRLLFLSRRYHGLRDSRVQFKKASGKAFWGSVYSVPVEDSEGDDYDGCVIDIDEQEQFIRKLTHITSMRKQIVLPGTVEEKLRQYTDAAVEMLNFQLCSIWKLQLCDQLSEPCTYDQLGEEGESSEDEGTCMSNQCLHLQACSGQQAEAVDEAARIPIGHFRLGRLIASQRDSILIHNIIDRDDFAADWVRDMEIKSYIAITMRDFSGNPIGAIDAYSKRDLTRTDEIMFAYLAELARDLLLNEGIKESLIEEHRTTENISLGRSAFFAQLGAIMQSMLTSSLEMTRHFLSSESSKEEPEKVVTKKIEQLEAKSLALVDRVRRYLTLEARLRKINPTPIELCSIAREMEAEFEAKCRESETQLYFEVDSSVPTMLMLDRSMIVDTVRLLLHKATNIFAGGSIGVTLQCIRCTLEDSSIYEAISDVDQFEELAAIENRVNLQISVIGTGKGIEHCRNLHLQSTDPFDLSLRKDQTIEPSANIEYDETCLDLPTVKQIVDMLGGTVSMECGIGNECRFVVAIPRIEMAEGKPVESDDQSPTPSETSVETGPMHYDPRLANLKVMIAEDAPESRQQLKEILQRLCVEPIAVTTGQEVMDKIKTAQPDIIFMDVQMPVLSGIDAARKIKENASTADILIIATFADVHNRQLQAEITELFDGQVNKPFQAEQIADQLTRCVSMR